MIIAIEGPELTDVNLKKFRTAEHSNSIVSVFMAVHILISVFASLVSCIMFSVREGFCEGGIPGFCEGGIPGFSPLYQMLPVFHTVRNLDATLKVYREFGLKGWCV